MKNAVVKMKDFERVFYAAEDVFFATDKCHLRRESRERIDAKISAFHKAVAGLPVRREKKRAEWLGAAIQRLKSIWSE